MNFICLHKVLNFWNYRKIICIGAPRLFEIIKNQTDFKPILLDMDDRLQSFYSPDELIYYNMFNHFFYCGPESQDRFEKFLKSPTKGTCLFVDPPFGCRTELLVQTLKTIQWQFYKYHKTVLPVILIFPYFMETYVKNDMPELKMMDFKVNYTNHKIYQEGGRKQFGSPVRIFTNIIPNLMSFDGPDYRKCQICDRYVGEANLHCSICNTCPSKNGSTYIHCMKCAECVKPYYVHCDKCHRCTQKDGHCCEEYQQLARCWICDEKGHLERFCPNTNRNKLINAKQKTRICLICGKNGHNERKCRMKMIKTRIL